MKVVRGYKTELDPTSEQYVLFCQCAGAARFAYNYGLARKQECSKQGQEMPYAHDLQRELTARKFSESEAQSTRQAQREMRLPQIQE